jgi:hypothetical protein
MQSLLLTTDRAHLDLARADIDLDAPASLRPRRPVKLLLPVELDPCLCVTLNETPAVLWNAALNQPRTLQAAERAAISRRNCIDVKRNWYSCKLTAALSRPQSQHWRVAVS